MVKYLVDSDILINFIRKIPKEVDLLRKIDIKTIAISVITYAEVMEGVWESNKKKEVEEFLGLFEKFDIGISTSVEFIDLRYKLRKQGNLIDNMDLLIASTAIEHDLILITNNKKDFQRIEGLKLL